MFGTAVVLQRLSLKSNSAYKSSTSRRVFSSPAGPSSSSCATKIPHSFQSHSSLKYNSSLNSQVVHRSYATIKKKSTSKKPKIIYDEDLDELGEDQMPIIDSTEEELNSKDYIKSSEQIEEILRQTLPPELVEKAILEHRRLYPSFQQGNLKDSDYSLTSAIPNDNLSSEVDPIKDLDDFPSLTSKSAKPVKSVKSKKLITKKSVKSKKSKLSQYSDDDENPMMGRQMTNQSKQVEELIDDFIKAGRENKKLEEEERKQYELMESGQELDVRTQRIQEYDERKAQEEYDKLFLHRKLERMKQIINDEPSESPKVIIKKKADWNTPDRSISATVIEARRLISIGDWEGALRLHYDLAKSQNSSDILSTFAHQSWKAGELEVTRKAATEAFNMDPNDFKANFILGRTLIDIYSKVAQDENESNDVQVAFIMAEQHIDRALEIHPDWPDVIGLKGSVLLARKKYKSASVFFEEAIKMYDKKAFDRQSKLPVYRDYAKALAGRGKYKSAEKYLKAALQLDENNVEIISLLAELHENGKGDIEAAAPYYRLAVQLNPEDVPSLVRLGQLYSDDSYSERDYEKAKQCYERAMVLAPRPDLFFPLGWICLHLGENQKAVQCLQKAAELDESAQKRWTSIVLMAEAYAFDTNLATMSSSLNKAVGLYSLAIEQNPDMMVRMNLAKCYLRMGEWQKAEDILQGIKIEAPENCELRCLLADTYYISGQTMEALAEVEEALLINPQELMPHFMKGKYLFEAGRFSEAIPYLERALVSVYRPSLDSPAIEELKKQITSAIQQTAEEFGDQIPKPSAAKVHPDSLIAEKSDDEIPQFAGEAFKILGKAYLALDKHVEAKATLTRACDFDPENSSLLVALGECTAILGDTEAAITAFRKAAVSDPMALRPNFQLGNLFADHEQYDQAITYYQKVFDILERRRENLDRNEEYGTYEDMSEQELADLVLGLYNNMSICYTKLAKLDKPHAVKYQKLAAKYAKLAHDFTKE